MHNFYNIFIDPFVEFSFMRYALVSIFYLSISSSPIGVFLIMRRMSLMGDAMSHAVLPGAAIGYLIAGLSLPAMSIGGFIAGLLMVIGAVSASRFSNLKEDANFAAFYLSCLALGVVLVSKYGSSVDLLTLLFGSILAVDREALTLIALTSSLTLIILAFIYRPLVVESMDSGFLKSMGKKGWPWHLFFQVLVVINLVSGFQALGTLMSVGLMMFPAICSRLWARKMEGILILTSIIGFLCGYSGLLLSYYVDIPSGPAIILTCAVIYVFSLIFGRSGGLVTKLKKQHNH